MALIFPPGTTDHRTSFWPKTTISNLTQDSGPASWTGHAQMHCSFAGLGWLLM